MTNARFASFHGPPVIPYAFSTTPVPLRKSARSSRAALADYRISRRASVCGSAAGVALRLRIAMRFSPPSAPLFPLADRRPKSCEDYFFFKALTFAQRALAAAEILALPAALILRLFFGATASATVFAGEPKIRPSSFSSDSICSLIAAARRNCCADRLMIELMLLN